MSSYLKRQNSMLDRAGLASLFPPIGEYSSDNVIVYDDGYIGKVYLCTVLAGFDESDISQLKSCLGNEFPAHSIIAFNQVSSSYIDNFLDIYKERRKDLLTGDNGLTNDQREVLYNLTRKRVELFEQSKTESMIPSSGVLTKNNIMYVSIKIPAKESDGEERVGLCNSLCESVRETLELIGMNPMTLGREEYAYHIRSILRMGENAQADYNENQTIAQQMTDFETSASVHKDYFQLNNQYIKSLSIQNLPEMTHLGVMDKLIGDAMGSNNQILDPFMLTTTIYYPDPDKTKKNFAKKEGAIIGQANGKIGTMIRMIQTKAEGLALFRDSIDEGNRPVQISVNLCIIGRTKEGMIESASKAKSFYETHQFILKEDKNIHFPVFNHNLPGFCNKQFVQMSNRFWTITTREAPHFLPVLGDSAGTGIGGNNIFISRRGQAMLCDIIDTDSNKNAVVAAASGMGKSFIANDVVTGALSKGAQVRIIDQGKSYEKLSEALKGQFIEFGEHSKICLNPFTKIQAFEEESEALTMLLGKMACPSEGLSDWQFNAMSAGIKDAWQQKGQNATITDVQTSLFNTGKETNDRRLTDLASQLSEFCRHGSYASYFEGRNNLDWNNNLVILELDDLKGKKRLESVVLMMLIIQIQRECYAEQNRGVQKIFMIDEAWSLFKDPELARFIEDAYRRFRKYEASCIVITQSLYDLYNVPVGGPVVENTNTFMLLGQEDGTVEKLKVEKRLGEHPYIYRLLNSIHTKKGKYSEIMFRTGNGICVVRFVVDRFTQLLYSSDGKEVDTLNGLRSEGLTMVEAIEKYIELESGSSKQHHKLEEVA